MTVTTWQHMPADLQEPLGISTQPQQTGEVSNRVIGGVLSHVNGQQVTELATCRASESDVVSRPAGMLSSVRNNGGFLTQNITPDCTVEIPGFGRTSVKVAEQIGYLSRNSDGTYREATQPGKAEGSPSAQQGTQGGPDDAQEGTPKGNQGDSPEGGPELFESGFEEEYGELIKDVPQGVYDSLLASANAHITEGLDIDEITAKLAPRLASSMGIEPGKAASMIDEGALIWQVQADLAVEKFGADPGDFYEWAHENRKDALQQAVNGHLFARSTKGYRDLVNDYFDNTIPTVDALKKGGIPVKEQGNQVMVKLKGHWMSLESAVKARMV